MNRRPITVIDEGVRSLLFSEAAPGWVRSEARYWRERLTMAERAALAQAFADALEIDPAMSKEVRRG